MAALIEPMQITLTKFINGELIAFFEKNQNTLNIEFLEHVIFVPKKSRKN